MSGLPIAALATVFGAVTLAVPAVVAYRFRRRPIVALIKVGERRAAFHRDALAALDSAIAAARAEGKTGEADRLVPERAVHIRKLKSLDGAREFPDRR